MKVLSAFLLLFFLSASVFVWFIVPEVQAFSPAWQWFLLPGLATLLVVGSRILSARLERYPGLLNLPDNARFRALPAERQRPVIEQARGLMNWLALEVTVVMGLIQLGLYHQRGGEGLNGFMVAGLGFALVVSPVVSLLYLSKMQTEVRRQVRAQEAEAKVHEQVVPRVSEQPF